VSDLAPRIPPRRRSTDLSEREWDVALLVARGLSNREIAEELVITKKTAEAHVSHILTKLGLRSRVQLATWIMQHGLDQVENDRAAAIVGLTRPAKPIRRAADDVPIPWLSQGSA
jgi:DNA-binding CsgD family transcriptional regulator